MKKLVMARIILLAVFAFGVISLQANVRIKVHGI